MDSKSAVQPITSASTQEPSPEGTAVHGLSADAATVSASVQTQSEVQPVLSPSVALGSRRTYLGQYPSEGRSNFLERGPLADRLRALMGEAYLDLEMSMEVSSPLQEDAGRWFITGNRSHEGGTEEAAIVVDAAQNAVRVWLLHGGTVREFQDPQNVTVPWPKDVETMQENARQAAKG